MTLVRWDAKYAVGNEVIDRDHQTLFTMVNDFYDAFLESNRRSDLCVILRGLVKYAEQHFQREEMMMTETGYPALEEHHEAHIKLYETIFQLHERLESDPAPLDRQTIAFLKTWLIDHVIAEDVKLGAFLLEQKEKETKGESADTSDD